MVQVFSSGMRPAVGTGATLRPAVGPCRHEDDESGGGEPDEAGSPSGEAVGLCDSEEHEDECVGLGVQVVGLSVR